MIGSVDVTLKIDNENCNYVVKIWDQSKKVYGSLKAFIHVIKNIDLIKKLVYSRKSSLTHIISAKFDLTNHYGE